MKYTSVVYKGKPLSLHKAAVDPDFGSRPVATSDKLKYVEMWLCREKKTDAVHYWKQARQLYEASKHLPKTSSPLTSYYCFLNATKALLIAKNKRFDNYHGVGGRVTGNRTCLYNERIRFKRIGVLAELCKYMGESVRNEEYTLKDLLYNLPYIHRSYNLTLTSQPTLFIPVSNPKFVRERTSKESCFCAEIKNKKYKNRNTLKGLPENFEKDNNAEGSFTVRDKNNFIWECRTARQKEKSIKELICYHRQIRKNLFYIEGPEKLWYLKRTGKIDGLINRSSVTITFAAMHRLSELVRYDPICLLKHFDSRHNWLITEFITVALPQFVDEISSEITGKELMMPGLRPD